MMGNDNATRCIPRFYILGAMKAGTGTLCAWLNGVPDVSVRSTEIHFWPGPPLNRRVPDHAWCMRTQAGLTDAVLQRKNRGSDCEPRTILGYKHPLLLWVPELPGIFAACRRHGLFDYRPLPQQHPPYPAPKMIVNLRDPAERARSQFAYMHRRVAQPDAFDRQVTTELQRAPAGGSGSACLRNMVRCLTGIGLTTDDVLSRSLYFVWLKEWLGAFDCRHLLLLRFEAHLGTDSAVAATAALQRVSAYITGHAMPFAGAEGIVKRTLQFPRPIGSKGRLRHLDANSSTRRRLDQFFAPFNSALWSLLAKRCRCVPLAEDDASGMAEVGGVLDTAGAATGAWWPTVSPVCKG